MVAPFYVEAPTSPNMGECTNACHPYYLDWIVVAPFYISHANNYRSGSSGTVIDSRCIITAAMHAILDVRAVAPF